MSRTELTEMVERFEEVTTGLITDHAGHVVKTIGDEVLFAVDDPREAALLALELVEVHEADEDFPEVRIGVAYGNVLNHMGDVFGSVVNVAARLTKLARPGRVLVDRAMAEQLEGDDELRLKRTRRTSVKGYEHLEPWSLRRPREKREDG
jgi:adenylate cyclase